MSQLNHNDIISNGFSSGGDSITPPSPRANRTRQLHYNTWKPQRRLFSYSQDDGRNFDHMQKDPTVNNVSQIGIQQSMSLHNHFGNRYFFIPPCVPYNLESTHGSQPSWVTYNLEGTHPYVIDGTHYESGQFNDFELSGAPCKWDGNEHKIASNSNGGDWVPKTMNLEGLDEVSCEIDDSDDIHFDTRAWKPGTISDQQWRILETISQGKSVFVTGSAGTGSQQGKESLHDCTPVLVSQSVQWGVGSHHVPYDKDGWPQKSNIDIVVGIDKAPEHGVLAGMLDYVPIVPTIHDCDVDKGKGIVAVDLVCGVNSIGGDSSFDSDEDDISFPYLAVPIRMYPQEWLQEC